MVRTETMARLKKWTIWLFIGSLPTPPNSKLVYYQWEMDAQRRLVT